MPVKGRIWIGVNSCNILHLETSLRDPPFDMQARRYPHRDTLTNHVLFDFDTRNKIANPAAASSAHRQSMIGLFFTSYLSARIV
jgi:hypothetical protein